MLCYYHHPLQMGLDKGQLGFREGMSHVRGAPETLGLRGTTFLACCRTISLPSSAPKTSARKKIKTLTTVF